MVVILPVFDNPCQFETQFKVTQKLEQYGAVPGRTGDAVTE